MIIKQELYIKYNSFFFQYIRYLSYFKTNYQSKITFSPSDLFMYVKQEIRRPEQLI